MSSLFELLENAVFGIIEFDGLERKLRAKGVNVQGSRTFTINVNGQKFEISYDGTNVAMNMGHINPSTPFLVNIQDLLARTKQILGEDTTVQAFIGTSSGVIRYVQDVNEIIDRQRIHDKKIYYGHLEMTLDKQKLGALSYIDRKDMPNDKSRILFSPELSSNPRIYGLIDRKYRATHIPSKYNLIFDLDEPLKSFSDFMALTKEVAKEIGANQQSVTSVTVEIPLRELVFLRTPPVLGVESTSPYRFLYSCEPPSRHPYYQPHGKMELRRLRLESPLMNLINLRNALPPPTHNQALIEAQV